MSERPVLDFEILEESWSDYELEDGSIVRMKAVLNYLLPDGKAGDAGLNVNTVIVTWSPSELEKPSAKGSALPVDELQKHIVAENLKHSCVREGVSRYATKDGTITLRLLARSFDRTDQYDRNGEPQYIVRQEIQFERPTLREKAVRSNKA